MSIGITDLKKGIIFKFNNEPFKVINYNQKVMGRGGSIVNVKIKSLIDSKVLEKTFKGNEKLELADLDNQIVDYLYQDGSTYVFINNKNFEQFEIDQNLIEDKINYLVAGQSVQLQMYENRPINIELPKNVDLEVVYTETAIKGDTSTSVTKDANLETGYILKVPSFIKIGDVISVDTTTGQYRERIKK